MIWFLVRIAVWFVMGVWITGGFDMRSTEGLDKAHYAFLPYPFHSIHSTG